MAPGAGPGSAAPAGTRTGRNDRRILLLLSGSKEGPGRGLAGDAAGSSSPAQHGWSLFCLCGRELTEIKHVLTSVHPVTGTF